jgi:hypothetical protein
MKKALVFALMFALGLGVAAFASPLTGTWDMSISIDPGATQAGDLFIDLSTSLAIDYTIAGWVFGSSSTFDSIGWSTQSFTASGVLGAFSFSSTMNFKPRTVTSVVWDFNNPEGDSLAEAIWLLLVDQEEYWAACWATDTEYLTETYGAAFDDWTAIGSVSIAGVTFEGLFFLEGYAGDAVSAPYAFYAEPGIDLVQTAGDVDHVLATPASSAKTLGSGWRFMASGSAGGMNITSYTYFNLKEAFTKDVCKQSLAKKGTYTIASPDCCVCFTEEYIYIDGFTFGCAENIAIGLDITCAGFNWLALEVDGLDLGLCCSGITADFQIKFGTLTKDVALCFGFEAKETTCFEFAVSLDYTDFSITGFTVDSVTFGHTWNGITFSSTTLFGSYSSTITDAANQILFMVPVTGMTNADEDAIPSVVWLDPSGVSVYLDPVCVYTEKYEVWESFTLASEGDSCCGGAFDFSITTSFGTKFELDAFAGFYVFNNAAGENVDAEWWYEFLEAGDVAPTWMTVLDMTELELDAWEAAHWYDNTVWAATATDEEMYAEGLLYGTLYDEAASDQLFQWVSTEVDLSIGLGSAWSLTFGLNIDVYGWNGLDFGFEFVF